MGRCGIIGGMHRCMSDRIASALRREFADGLWRAGATLPDLDTLRIRFGAGEYAIRHALRRLRDEGLVVLRQNVGAVVADRAAPPWKGRILFIDLGAHGSYFEQEVSLRLSARFCSAGWDFVPVGIAGAHDGSADLAPLLRQLANGASFAIGLSSSRQIAACLAAASVPYAALDFGPAGTAGTNAAIRPNFSRAFADMASAMRSCGVRRVVEFDYERRIDREFKQTMTAAGLEVRRVLCRWDDDSPWSMSDVRRCGHAAVARFFAVERNRRNPPNAILFDDDYLASGGIVALLEAGLRIPDDVKVVTYCNRGDEPVAGVPLARIECDPTVCADAAADYTLAVLEGKRPALPRPELTFIPGDSL